MNSTQALLFRYADVIISVAGGYHMGHADNFITFGILLKRAAVDNS